MSSDLIRVIRVILFQSRMTVFDAMHCLYLGVVKTKIVRLLDEGHLDSKVSTVFVDIT